MFNDEHVEFLSRTELFKGLSTDELKLLSDKCEKETFHENDIIIKEGQSRASIYIVLKGRLKISISKKITNYSNGRDQRIELGSISAGNCFGEYSLLDKNPSSASVEALESGQLLKITRESFEEIVSANSNIAKNVYYNLLQILVKRLRKDNFFHAFASKPTTDGVFI